MNFLLVLGLAVLVRADDTCPLMNGIEPSKPSPSLWKCYKYNKLACCVSTHDNEINKAYQRLLSPSCQRSFSDLETYFCTGCNPTAGNYIDPKARTLKVCRSFAEAIWGNILEMPSNSFDNCGLNTYWRTNSTTVMQSKEWPNAYAFFAEMKPTYFEDYQIILTPGDDDCFDEGQMLTATLLLAGLLA
jgi:hypothetical protein